ncbi:MULTISPECIES: hypothetical protein [unclassified Leucobacter]|uniref:hypothetical protein n=1 Tax=unclassified Leucobacter TaxID=2621730 RepID=UPI003019EB04
MSDSEGFRASERRGWKKPGSKGSSARNGATRSGMQRPMLVLISLGVVLVLGLGTLVAVQFAQLQQLRDPAAAEAAQSESAKQVVQRAGKLMLLPDEEATIATVEDAKSLASQAFFAKTKKGDKVLIFPEAELAVIYRPAADVIVNAGPLVLNAAELAQTQAGTPAEEIPTEAPAEETPAE